MRLEHWLYTAPLRLRSLFRPRSVDQELEEELQFHLDQNIQEAVARGLTPEAARRQALRAMDGLTQRKEECRDQRGVSAIEDTLRDIRYGLRVLAHSPAFTATAVLTLALGIGANSVVFGVLNALILRPLNLPRAESLYAIQRDGDKAVFQSYPDYLDLRDRNRSFESLAIFNASQPGFDSGRNPAPVWAYETSGNYFDALGVQPYLGRFFHASDEHGPNSAPYIVLTHAFWHSHFEDDRAVVGRTVRLNKHPFTIIGVAPPGFLGTMSIFTPEFFVPIVDQELVDGVNTLNRRGERWIMMALGHLKPGVTPAQAAADLNSIGAWLAKTYPKEDSAVTLTLSRPGLGPDLIGRPARAFVAGLMLLAALILLAACANLGVLFAARAAGRAREVALRLALGAGRSRILRQLLTEAFLISLFGGGVGLLGSVALLHRLSAWQPFPRFPIHVPVDPDARVYLAALVLALASGLLFGLVPVRQVLRADPYQIVKAGSAGFLGRRITVRELLLAGQIAICAVLVTSSMVAVRGLLRSLHGNFGFDPRHVMLLHTDLNMAGYDGNQVAQMQRRMIDKMQAIPGVDSASVVDTAPLTLDANTLNVYHDETADLRPSNAAASSYVFSISPDYFRTAGTALLTGRTFSWHDDKDAPRAAIVNRQFAAEVFGSVANSVGKYFKRRDGTRFLVVGVVQDGKYLSLTESPQAAVFLPIIQAPSNSTWLVVRSSRDPQQLAAAMRRSLRELDPGLPAFLQTWTQALDGVLFPARVATAALGVLGLMGAMLSITGIFGMAAYSVSKRLRELGIRMALGARRSQVLQTALGRAFKLLAFGSAAGLLLGIFASRVLAFIVYQATPRDPLVLTAVVLAMLLLGLLATWIPAQRALSVDPSALLREE